MHKGQWGSGLQFLLILHNGSRKNYESQDMWTVAIPQDWLSNQ